MSDDDGKFGGVLGGMTDKVSDIKDSVADKAGSGMDSLKEKAEDMKDKVTGSDDKDEQ